jgi:hypothetical protein
MVTAERIPARPDFANEPFVDFSKPENRKAMEDALRKVVAELAASIHFTLLGRRSPPPRKRTLSIPRIPARS